jgi:hypothetical protein
MLIFNDTFAKTCGMQKTSHTTKSYLTVLLHDFPIFHSLCIRPLGKILLANYDWSVSKSTFYSSC